ncbi:MAG: hypothetical protein HOO92_16705 [Methylococcaceae bacterium]|nr:hypothetical protein [Methylococcaceae bacterium]
MTFANAYPIHPKDALIELTLLNAEHSDESFDDLLIDSLKRNIPPEIATRLLELWSQTKVVAGEVVAVGKIIVRKIIDFLLNNPKMTIGIAIGAALSVLVAGIPFIGPLLAPLVAALSILYGAGVGSMIENGDFSGSIDTAIIEVAKKFFELLVNIINGVKEYWNSKS